MLLIIVFFSGADHHQYLYLTTPFYPPRFASVRRARRVQGSVLAAVDARACGIWRDTGAGRNARSASAAHVVLARPRQIATTSPRRYRSRATMWRRRCA